MRRNIRLFLMLGLLSFVFVGCTAKNGETLVEKIDGNEELQPVPFLVESVSLELPETIKSSSSWINGYIFASDKLIFNMNQADLLNYDGNSVRFYQRSFQMPLEDVFSDEPWYQNHAIYGPEEVIEEIEVPEDLFHEQAEALEFINRFVRGKDGHIYYLSSLDIEAAESDEYVWTVYKCDFDTGECVEKWTLTDIPTSVVVKEISENSLHDYYMQVDEEDTLYLVDEKSAKLYIIPKSGTAEKTVNLPEDITSDYVWNPQGQLQFIGKDDSGKGTVYYLDVEEGSVGEMTEVSCENVQALGLDEQGRVCYYTGMELFFQEDGQRESFLKYDKVIVKPEDLLCFRVIDNSVIYLDDCRKLIRHTKSNEHVGVEKQIITVGYAGYLDDVWNQYVTGFNNSSLYYKVQMKEYDADNGHERLLADLSTGRGPDVFFTDIALVREFVKNDLIEDLRPFLQDGKGLEEEHFVQSILEANTYEQILYTIPQAFSLDLLLGMEDNFAGIDNMSWTVSEYMDIVRNCGGMEILGGKYVADTKEWGRALITMPVLERNLDYYADEEKGRVRFNEEEFVELMNLASNYQYRNFGNNGFEAKKKLLEGDLLLENWMITNVQTFLENRAILGNQEIYLTYPSVSGEGGYGIANYGSLSINAGSENKEGAWQFMQYVLNIRGSRHSVSQQYFSSKEVGLTYQLECATVKQYQYDTNGIGYLCDKDGNPIEKSLYSGEHSGISFQVYAATKEDLELLRELIDGVSFSNDLRNDLIFNIAWAEIGDMTSGINDVEGAIHNLQNRVGLYLEERR